MCYIERDSDKIYLSNLSGTFLAIEEEDEEMQETSVAPNNPDVMLIPCSRFIVSSRSWKQTCSVAWFTANHNPAIGYVSLRQAKAPFNSPGWWL